MSVGIYTLPSEDSLEVKGDEKTPRNLVWFRGVLSLPITDQAIVV